MATDADMIEDIQVHTFNLDPSLIQQNIFIIAKSYINQSNNNVYMYGIHCVYTVYIQCIIQCIIHFKSPESVKVESVEVVLSPSRIRVASLAIF